MPYRHLLTRSLFILLLGLGLTLLFSSRIFGQENEATPSISEETIKENIRERLQDVVKSANTEANSPSPETTKRAWAGLLTDITNSTLTLTVKSEVKQAKLSAGTVIVDAKRQTIEPDELEIDTFVIAMGYLTAEGVLDTRRVVESPEPSPLTLTAYFVTIERIDDEILTVKNMSDDNSWELSLEKNVLITHSVDGQSSDIELEDLKVGDELVIIGSQNSDTPTTLDTTNIHLVSSRTIPAVESVEATPSATN